MFAKKFRLPAYIKFPQKNSYLSQFFIFKLLPNSLYFNRYGFIVSKAVAKNAVARNRLKRKFRAHIEDFCVNLKDGFDMLFIIRRKFFKKDQEYLLSELMIGFKKAEITK